MKKPAGGSTKSGRGAAPAVTSDAVSRKPVRLAETGEGLPWHSNHEVKKEANPFLDGDWRMLLYAWSGMALRLVLVLGTLFTAFQYLAAREEKRIERALSLVELWERPEYQQAQRSVKQRLSGLNDKFSALIGATPSKTELAVYYEKIGIEAMKPEGGTMSLPEFQGEFDQILYFLNRLAFCVEGNLCSDKIAEAYFRDYAVSFWGYFAGYVAKQRQAGNSTFAKPLEDYVRANRPAAGAP